MNWHFAEKLVETLRSEGLQPQFLPAMLNTLRKRASVGASKSMPASTLNSTAFRIPIMDAQPAAGKASSRSWKRTANRPRSLLTIAGVVVDYLQRGTRGACADTIAALAAILAADVSPRAMDILGSLGLTALLKSASSSKTINDLTRIGLDAFTTTEAERFSKSSGEITACLLTNPLARPFSIRSVGRCLITCNSSSTLSAILTKSR